MVQLGPFGARQEVIVAPTFGGPIAAAGKEPVQHGEVNGPFDVKSEPPAFEQDAQGLRDPAFLPQTAEDQLGPDAAHGRRLGFPGGVGVQHGKALTMAHARAH